MMRLQLLGNPELLSQLRQVRPFSSYPIPQVDLLYNRPNLSWLMRQRILPLDSPRS